MVGLIEKPHTLKLLKEDPKSFIAKSALSKAHKQILLSNDAEKIKSLVSDVAGAQELKMVFVTAPGKPAPAVEPEGMVFIFGAEEQKVKVAVKPKFSKKSPIATEMAAIVFVTDAEV